MRLSSASGSWAPLPIWSLNRPGTLRQPEPRHCARNAGLSRPGVGPGPVDFALIAVPATLATAALEASIAKGVRAVVMFTAGYAETERKAASPRNCPPKWRGKAVSGSAARIASGFSICAPDIRLWLLSRGGDGTAGAARHGDPIRRLRDAPAGARQAPRHLERGVDQHR